MKRVAIVFAIAFSLAISTGAGFWFGVREGWSLAGMADSIPRGALSAALLESLESGKTDFVISTLESDVDNGLLWSHELGKSRTAGYLDSVWGLYSFPQHDEDVIRLAKYRKAHVSPYRGLLLEPPPLSASAEDHDLHKQLIQIGEDNDVVITKMVQRYGDR
ncbi:MAG TPA: hypothetical protein VIF82_05415 [Burkholderiaceae bacterium]|jgi:hypothetical protein